MPDDLCFETRYRCPHCGRKVTAFDTKVMDIHCTCGRVVRPVLSKAYNLSNVRHWLFWDQVDEYATE